MRDVCPLEGGEPWPPLILFNFTIKNLAWIQQWFMIREFSLIGKTMQWILGIPLTFLKVILWHQEFQTVPKLTRFCQVRVISGADSAGGHRCTCPPPLAVINQSINHHWGVKWGGLVSTGHLWRPNLCHTSLNWFHASEDRRKGEGGGTCPSQFLRRGGAQVGRPVSRDLRMD